MSFWVRNVKRSPGQLNHLQSNFQCQCNLSFERLWSSVSGVCVCVCVCLRWVRRGVQVFIRDGVLLPLLSAVWRHHWDGNYTFMTADTNCVLVFTAKQRLEKLTQIRIVNRECGRLHWTEKRSSSPVNDLTNIHNANQVDMLPSPKHEHDHYNETFILITKECSIVFNAHWKHTLILYI